MPGTSRHDYELLYDPPRAAVGGVPGEFRAKVWFRVVLAVFPGAVAAVALVFPVLSVSGGLLPPGPQAAGHRQAVGAVAFSVLALILGSAALLFAASVVARRGPAVRACREGVEVRLIGPSRVYGVPSAPDPVRLTWAFLSGRPCRLPMARLSWQTLAGVSVRGGSFWSARALIFVWAPEPGGTIYWVMIPQSEIAAPVGKVAAALLSWSGDENARALLPGWGEPA